MLGLCLIAVLAVAAIASTSASALPEWGQCFKKGAGGKYTDSNCTKKATLKSPGEFEFRKGTEIAHKHFEGGNVGSGGVLTATYHLCSASTFEGRKPKCNAGETETIGSPISIECTSEHNTGEATGTKEVKNVSVKFMGCKAAGSIPCANTPVEGEIIVNPLKGSLGYINKAKKEVGVLLEPAIKHGEFAKFVCGPLGSVVGVGNAKEGAAYTPETTGGYDGIISPITPVNTMSSAFTQVYTINEADENIPSKFEGKHIELLESYIFNPENPAYSTKWSKAGETITNTNTPEEAVEIKA
jgi:hypothetical protein